jgi:multiple sugar transport system permease protein
MLELKTEKQHHIVRKKLAFRRYLINYLGLAPFFILFVIFILVPIVQGIVMSFTDWSTASKGTLNFVGLENYKFILSGEGTSSQRFFTSLKNLAIYVPITIAIGLSISLALALIVRHIQGRLYKIYRNIFFIPTVLPIFLCVGIFQWFMTSDVGILASLLEKIGIGENVNWTETAGYAIALVVMIDVWNAVGFNFIIFITGMQDISEELYEAAEMDGATTFQKMRYITIPLLEPIIFLVVTYSFFSALQVYDIPWILTSNSDINSVGGTGQVMLFPVMEMVRNVYNGSASGLGRASAEGVILMLIIIIITLILYRLRRKTV